MQQRIEKPSAEAPGKGRTGGGSCGGGISCAGLTEQKPARWHSRPCQWSAPCGRGMGWCPSGGWAVERLRVPLRRRDVGLPRQDFHLRPPAYETGELMLLHAAIEGIKGEPQAGFGPAIVGRSAPVKAPREALSTIFQAPSRSHRVAAVRKGHAAALRSFGPRRGLRIASGISADSSP